MASTAVIAVANAVLNIVAWDDLASTDAYPNTGSSVAGLVYASLGVIIVRRVCT